MNENTPTPALTAEAEYCSQCGEEFTPSKRSNWTAHYCSYACSAAAGREYERDQEYKWSRYNQL